MTRWRDRLVRLDECRWELPPSYKPGMRVPVLVYAAPEMIDRLGDDESLEQAANVAFLPGIVGRSLAMPDFHEGYGFPIGGVAATRIEDGVVSPGGVGFDINCGVRVLRTSLREEDVRPQLADLATQLFRDVPAGVGGSGQLRVGGAELDRVMEQGAAWAVERGLGRLDDLEMTESGGRLSGADPASVSGRARERGAGQLGTLGSGNHFLEVQALDEVFDPEAAEAFGLGSPGQVLVFFHCGSRGFGHQVCQDYLGVMEKAAAKHHIELPDRQLACAPIRSPEGAAYLSAMTAAANYAWANRQCITHYVRSAFARVFRRSADDLGLDVLYDVAHNTAKIERHRRGGRDMEVCVHRKGATRAFPAGHGEVPVRYRAVGQPVLIPGDMGRYSYLAVGTPLAMEETWGSICHGAGRAQSRHAARRMLAGVDIAARLAAQGIVVRAQNRASLAEEASEAYKDVAEVVAVLDRAGISRRVARLRPLAVVKG